MLILIISLFFIYRLGSGGKNVDSFFNSPSCIDKHDLIDFDSYKNFKLSTTTNKPIYKLIENDYDLNKFIRLPLRDKCKIYFDKLFEMDPNWELKPVMKDQSHHDDSEMNENLVHLNIYNSCFMGKYFDKKLFDSFPGIDQKFNPFLTGYFPIFQHWNGDLFYGPNFQKIKNYYKSLKNNHLYYNIKYLMNNDKNFNKFDFSEPYWKYYKEQSKGSGISISIADNITDHTLLLIGNLRTIETKLPVQLVHKGDLSNSNKLKLIEAARKDYKNLPKLDLWFVDLDPTIKHDFDIFYRTFYNKLLTYSFTTYENLILLDADVILFHDPNIFFQTSQYLESDSLFFKDRNIDFKVGNEFVDFLRFRSPSIDDHLMFGLNEVRPETFDLEYFKYHNFFFMEAGVVVINRLKFWNGVFTTLHLSLFGPITDSTWGDKELYWISLILSGLDNFKFDKNWSGSVGKPTTDGKSYYNKICSSHPAHILSDNDKLSWLNSGVLNCKKSTNHLVKQDFQLINDEQLDLEGLKFNTPNDLKKFYESPISFDAFIIPPNSEFSIPEDELTNSNFKSTGWHKLEICIGYIWCAVDKLGDGTRDGSNGQFILFDKAQVDWYEYVTNNYLSFVEK